MPKVVTATVVVLLLVAMGLTGCEKGAPPPPEEKAPTAATPSADEMQALQQLQSYAQQNGLTLSDVMQRLTQPPATATSPTPITVQPDLKVLGWLLGWAKKSAASQDAVTASDRLVQANRMARAILAEMPSQQVAVDLERTLADVSGESPDNTGALLQLNAAIDVLTTTPDQALVPSIEPRLKALRDGLSANPATAADPRRSALESPCSPDRRLPGMRSKKGT